MSSDKRQIIKQINFTSSPLGKAFKKQMKAIEEQVRKLADDITNQNERLVALTNKDDHKDNYKKIFEELVKERFDGIKELTDNINKNDLTYYLKGNTARERFDNFIIGIGLF